MESEILQKLNEEQKQPASITEGAVLVTAGAGSGKTRLLTHRIAHIIKDLGVNPWNILAITFTNKAANEMKERLLNMVVGSNEVWVSTFHSLCAKILRMHIDRIGFTSSFSIYGDTEKERILKRLIGAGNEDLTVNTVSWHISNAKNKLLGPDEYESEVAYNRFADEIVSIYRNYEKEKKQNNALDFDDLLSKTYELFKACPDVLESYQHKFKYIHVDEFQDTNTAQYNIVKMLAGKWKNIFVVGDEDQCIYSWRGAEVANVQKFAQDYEDVKVFKLQQNYRSTKKILEKANKLIECNKQRIKKELWTDNSDGARVEFFTTSSDLEEAEYVAQTIKRLQIEHGYKLSDIGILMRVNSLSRVLEEKLLNYQISHQIYGGFKFYERKEIKDVVAYLRVLVNTQDSDALSRVFSFPKKGIGDTTISNLLTLSTEYEKSVFELMQSGEGFTPVMVKKLQPVTQMICELQDACAKMPLDKFVEHMVDKVGFKEAIGSKTEEDVSKQMNIDTFVMSVKEFVDVNPGISLSEFLETITLMRDIDEMDDSKDFVSIMTVHSAKGLEFKVVFVVGLNEGLFPLSRAIKSEDPNELEEERRLMYVAITRAKERLYLLRSSTKFSFETRRVEQTMPSRFLKEMKGEEDKEIEEANHRVSSFNEDIDFAFASRVSVAKDVEEEEKIPATEKKTSVKYSDFKKGVRVSHPHFGEGEVLVEVTDFVGAFVTIKFEKVGIKTLSLKFAPITIIE